jgi:hypothetical protein
VVIDYTTQDVQAAVTAALEQQQQQQEQQQEGTKVMIVGGAEHVESGKASAVAVKPSSSSSSSSSRCGSSISSKLDLVVDNVGGSAHMSIAVTLLKPRSGMYVTSVPLANPQSNSLWSVLSFFARLASHKALHRIAPGRFPAVAFNGASPDGAKVQRLVDWLAAAGEIVHSSCATKCLVRLTEYDLQEAGEALAVIHSKGAVGKLVLRVRGDL